jgi:hypothetical protein
MSVTPDMRAGDEDRDRTITVLREAFAEGRLTQDEFQERLGKAQEARTYGELDALVTDLPVATPAVAKPSPAASVPAPVEEDDSHSVRNGWYSWLGVSILVNVIYVATWITGGGGSAPYYWPIWVMGPWGAAMVIATLNKRR